MSEHPTMPASIEAERALLGALILHPKCAADVVPLVEPADFYHPAHESIASAIWDLDSSGQPIDAIAIAERMRAAETFHRLRDLGGAAYFAGLMSDVVTVENVTWYARAVAGKARIRRLIQAATEIRAHAFGEYGDADDFLSRAEAQILEVTTDVRAEPPRPVGAIADEVIATMQARAEARADVIGIPSKLCALDGITSGAQPGDLLILAARPSCGKTALAVQWAEASAEGGDPALVVSLEMAPPKLVERVVSGRARVNAEDVRRGRLEGAEWKRVYQARGELATLPLEITNKARTVTRIRAEVRRWRARWRKRWPACRGLVVVDYLGLVDEQRVRGESKSEAIGRVAKALKDLAQECDVAVICLCQLNRESEKQDRPPRMSDLRDSGEIEQHADVVIFLHTDGERHVAEREVKAIVDKNRNGDTATAALRFLRPYTRFVGDAQQALVPPLRPRANGTHAGKTWDPHAPEEP